MLLLPLLFVGAAAPAPQTLKLGTIVPAGSIWDKAVRRMGAEWKKETAGRVSIRVYPGGIQGDEPDLIRKMRIGQLQGAVLSASGLGDIEPAFRIFETPMFFRTDGETRPFIFQEELPVQVQALAEGSELEINENQHQYGVKAIHEVGYGFWQDACLVTLI